MKAMVIREFGEPRVMRLEEVATPAPGPGEVLLEVHAVSVNRTLDLTVRSGKYPLRIQLPHVLGVAPSGVIAAIGRGVAERKVGDRVAVWPIIKAPTATQPLVVLGVHLWGGYAEYVKVPAERTFILPDQLDFETATVVARHAPHALHLLRDAARLQSGEIVLVMGATGGLGSAGIQVAKQFGARVIAGAGADDRVQAAMRLGADFGVNYRSRDLADEVLAVTAGRGVDVVFENIGDPDLFPKALASLAQSGRLVTSGSHGGGKATLDISRLYLRNITVVGTVGRLVPGDMEQALAAAASGRYKVLIDRSLPLAEAARAHEIVAERSGIGKILLRPNPG